MKSIIALIMSVAFVAYAAGVIAGEDWKGKIYWVDYLENKIGQANYDGSNKTIFVKTSRHPTSLIIDAKNGFMYWTNWVNRKGKDLTGSIKRCQMVDCTNTIITFIAPGKIAKPSKLTLDRMNGYIYWPDYNRDLIQRSKLDGSDVETVLILKAEYKPWIAPVSCEIDEENAVLYWTEKYTNRIGRIKLANLKLPYTPKESDYIVTEGLDGPYRIRIDKGRHKIFISENIAEQISVVSLDGGIPSEIVKTKSIQPAGLALDRKAGKIFFLGKRVGYISSVNMDGTGLKKICDDVGIEPMDIFFVPKTD